MAKPQLDEMDCAMLGLVTGPLTLASHLAGVRIFTAVKKKKDFAHAVIAYAGKFCAQSAQFYTEMGCDIIAIVDPVASQIRPETFQEYVTPNCQEAVTAIHDALISLAAGGTHGFTFAPGWDIPFDVPAEHLIQAYEAREWYHEHYPKYPEL